MTLRTAMTSGIALRLTSAFLISAMSAVVHHLAATVPVGQIIFWRSLVAVLPIAAYMALRGRFPAELFTARPGLHVTRSLFGVLSMALSFTALSFLPVANAQALAFLAPVLTVPLAALLLGEGLGPRVVLAVLTGFAGVLAMLWSSLSLPGDGAAWGVAAGLGFACSTAFVRVHVKAMTATEAPATIALWFALTGAVAGLASWPLGWVATPAPVLGLLGAAGLLGGLAHIAATEATARAPISVLAAFDYTGLVWALGFDLLLFGLVPGPAGLAGVALIALAGALVMHPGRVPPALAGR